MQVIADPAGRLVWASVALPGSTHDLTAARAHRIIDALTSEKVMTFADKADATLKTSKIPTKPRCCPRAGNPRPAPRREPNLRRMKMARCSAFCRNADVGSGS